MIGRTISHYRVISRVGAGGMGTVWLADDTTLGRRVALKFLSEGSAHTGEATARLLREARAASALDHPHIATIYDVGEFEGQPYIAMAFYEGETLAERLARDHSPPPTRLGSSRRSPTPSRQPMRPASSIAISSQPI